MLFRNVLFVIQTISDFMDNEMDIRDTSLIECGRMCVHTESCSSFFYSDELQICQMSSFRYNTSEGLTPALGYNYYMDDPCRGDPCNSRGTCTGDNSSPSEAICSCQTGYIGKKCEKDDLCLPDPCNSHGKCTFYDDDPQTVNCTCDEGYMGDKCDTVDPCNPNPCGIGATCTVDNGNPPKRICTCQEGRYGETCEKDCTQDKWTLMSGQCYQYVGVRKTFDEAKASCIQLGGFLAIAESAADDTIMDGISIQQTMWIGGFFNHTTARWEWVNGEEMTFTSWDTERSQPNGGDYCVEHQDRGWHDGWCLGEQFYLCEK